MIQNIKYNHKVKFDSKLYYGKYYDYAISDCDVAKQTEGDLDDMKIVDFSQLNIVSGSLISSSSWGKSANKGVHMEDIGFTAVDNGLISFEKDRITNKEFLSIYLDSEYDIESGNTSLFLSPITGNTQMYTYPMSIEEENGERYIKCNGGFYQGFFKLEGFCYQVLPTKLEDEWCMNFILRPQSKYEVETTNVNYIHPDNKGIFFFMGTRAENKFWPFYKTNSAITSTFLKEEAKTQGYFSGCCEVCGITYDTNNKVVFEKEWLADELPQEREEGYFAIGDDYFAYNDVDINKAIDADENFIVANERDYFTDGYYNDKKAEDNNKAIETPYIGQDVDINSRQYIDSNGNPINEKGYFELETDNKHILFDRTENGFTTDTWIEGTVVKLTGRKDWPNANYFLLMDRTPTGYTVDTIDGYNEANSYDYNIYKDIRNNVFALRITDDGAIGYRYGVLDCDSEDKYKLLEEYSKDGLVKDGEWNSINVRFIYLGHDTMKMLFYVNSYLVFVSKEIPSLSFKSLDEVAERQEGVPYNISLGGGTLGLIETIVPNYYAISDYILPIERDFCGTFMGDIKTFKMYNGFVNYSSINNYLS